MSFSLSGQRRDDASRGGDEPERDAGHTGRWVLDDPGWWPSFKLGPRCSLQAPPSATMANSVAARNKSRRACQAAKKFARR